MPSRFGIRQAIGLRRKPDGTPSTSSAGLAPPQGSLPIPSATAPSASACSSTDNVAFDEALKQHLQKLDQSEKDTYSAAYQNITLDDLFSRVTDFDRRYNEKAISRRCAEPVTRFLGIVEEFFKGVAIGIQSNPEISSIVLGAVRIIIDLAVKFVTFFNRLTEMMTRLAEHLGHLNEYAKAAKGSKLLQTTLASVYGDLLAFCSQARSVFVDEHGAERKWLSIKIFIRVQWEPFEAKFGAIDTSVRHHLEVLLHSVQALQINAIERGNREAESERQRVREKENAKERKDFLTWISNRDFEKDHDIVFSKRHPGTGTWLLREPKVEQWVNMHSSALLWCYGKPGVGKSVLSSIMLDHVVASYPWDHRVAIAFAYIKYDLPDSQQPLEIISAMIKQLCWKKGTIPQDLLRFFHKYDGDARPRDLDTTIFYFIHLLKSYDQVFLIFDALDECKQELRGQMLDIIIEVITQVPTAKIFVASRKETDIVEAFAILETPKIEIGAKNVEEDIDRFVTDRVKHLIETKKLKIKETLLEGKIIETLTAQADGMFLWVNLQLETLCKQRSDRDIEKELLMMPQGLDATYQRILELIDLQPKALKSLAQKALMWVLYAVRPLTAYELVDAVAIEETCSTGDNPDKYPIEVILESCSNLLIIESWRIKLIHFSVQEYLTNPPRSGTSTISSSPFANHNNAHIQLAKRCMSYLMLGFLASGPCKDANDYLRRFRSHDLAVYASQCFDEHIYRVESITPDLEEKLDVLLCCESRVLAAILQLRQYGYICSEGYFKTYSWPVNAKALVYSTTLFNLEYLQAGNTWWKSLELPKYTLHEASWHGTIDAIRHLVELGHDVNEKDERGNPPVYYASLNCQIELVRILFQLGADVNVAKKNVLQAASTTGSVVLVQLLLDRGAEVNAQGGEYGTALQVAACCGSTEIVQLLLDKGAEINAQGGKYGTALQAAARYGRTEIIQLLLDRGAEVNARGGSFGTALQTAAEKDHDMVVKLLLQSGAKVNATGLHRKYCVITPLVLARKWRCSETIEELLVDAGGVDSRIPEGAAADDEVADDEVTDDEVTDDEVTDDDVTDDEVTDDEVMDDEVTDDEVMDDEVTDDEVPNDETVD